MLNKNLEKMELYKTNLISPIAISPCDGAIGYNHLDTHQIILPTGVWHVKDGPFGAAHNEYLAYLLSRELKLSIPETVISMVEEDIKYKNNTRLMRGKTFHSAQRYIVAELGKYFDYSALPEEKQEHLIRQIARMDIFDYIIGNNDRHNKNFMINEEGNLFLIDNGWGGIGNEKIDLHCNRGVPDWLYKKPLYLDESLNYQKNLLNLLPEEKVTEIASIMKEFEWKTWNCHYDASYKICLPPDEKTIEQFSQILLDRMEKLTKIQKIPFPLNQKNPQ